MDQSLATGFLAEVNERTDAGRLLELLGYATDKVQVVGESVKAFCPIHRDTKFRSLVIDAPKHTFKCTIKNCAGYSGGTLVDLYALARREDPVAAASQLVRELGLDVNPAWNGRLVDSQLEAARTALAEGNSEAAEKATRAALGYSPASVEAHLLLARIHTGRGEPDQACSEYAAAADAHLAESRFAEADQLLADAVGMFPESEDLFFLQVRSAELQGRNDEVIRLLEDLASDREAAGQALDNLGIYQRLIELQPDNPSPRLRLAALHESRRDMRNACREMEKAAQLLISQKRGSEAVPLLEQVLRCEPQQNRLRLLLADELIRDGDYPRAKEQIFEVANQQIENSEFVAAEKTVRRWLDIEPDSLETFETLARIFQEQERQGEAAEALRRAAEAARRTGANEAALSYLFRIKFLQPEDVALRQDLVEQLASMGQMQRAGFELVDLAEVHFARNDNGAAEAALSRASSLDESPAFQLQVADVLRAHGRDEGALDLVRKAVRTAEAAGNSQDTLEAYERLTLLQPDDLSMAEKRVRLLWKNRSPEAPQASVELLERLSAPEDEDRRKDLVLLAAEHVGAIPIDDSVSFVQKLFETALEQENTSGASALYGALVQPLRWQDRSSALQCAERLASFNPQERSAVHDIASLSRELGDHRRAADAFLELSRLEEEDGEIQAALESLDSALASAPDRPEILKQKARLVEKTGGLGAAAPTYRDYLLRLRATAEVDKVFAEYESYLAQNPGDAVARRHVADLLAEAGRRDEAAASYSSLLKEAEEHDDVVEILHLRERLLALDPENPDYQASLAAALLEVGDSSQALEYYLFAIRGFLEAGRNAEAIASARAALDAEPGETEVLELLAEAAVRHGDAEAREEALAALAGAFRDQGQFERALEYVRGLVDLRPDVTSYRLQVAELLDASGQPDAGLTEWKALAALLEENGNGAEALAVYARLVDRLDGSPETLQHWNSLASGPAGTVSDRFLSMAAMAGSHLREGDQERGRELIADLLKLAPRIPAEAAPRLLKLAELAGNLPDTGTVYQAAASCFRAAGQPGAAVESLRKAVESAPSNIPAHEALVELYEGDGRLDEAFTHRLAILQAVCADKAGTNWQDVLKTVREHSGENARRRLAVARALLECSNSDARTEAVLELENTVRSAVTNGETGVVLEATDAAPQIAAASPLLRNSRVDVLLAAGRTDEAAQWLHHCATTALAEGLPEDAESAVARWLEIQASDPEAFETAGEVYHQLGRPKEALEALLSAAESWRANAEYDGAARSLRSAARVEPQNFAIRRQLWETLLEGGKEGEAIAEMVSLADAMADSGDFGEAENLLGKVLERQPDSADAIQSLAKYAYKRAGFSAALPHFRQLLVLKRSSSSPEELIAVYESILAHKGATVDLRAEYADFLEETGHTEAAKRQLLLVAQEYRDDEKDLVRAVEYFGRTTAIAHSPEDAPIFEELASLHLALKVPAFAAGALREAARLYDAWGKSAAAIQCARQALELSEGTQRIEDLALLGNLQARFGKAAEGAGYLREALEIASTDSDTTVERRRELCSALLDADPTDLKTAEYYLQLLPDRELPECAVSLSRRFAGAGCAREQMQLLKLAKSMAPGSLVIRREMAETLFQSGEDPEKLKRELVELCEMAAKAKDRAIASEALKRLEGLPGSGESPLLLAPLYALTGDTENAVARYAAAADNLAAEGRFDDAADALRTAMELDASAVPVATVAALVRRSEAAPSLRTLAERLLETAIRARSRTRALVISTALLEYSSPEVGREILRRIGQGAGAAFVVAVAGAHADWLYERDRTDEASSLADFVTGLVPNSPDAWWLASQLHRKAGRSQPAADAALKAARLFNEAGAVTEEESCYREALEQFPNDIPVLETLAFFYDREKRVGDALEVMRRLASLTSEAGDFAAAANWMRKILAYAPNDDVIREQFAEVLLRLKRVEEAAGHLLELARSHSKRGHDAEAEAIYERLLEIEPDNEQAAAYLLDRATRREDPVAVARYTVAMATVKAESGALNQACQMLKNLLVREPENLDALEKLAAFSKRAQDMPTFRSASLSLAQKLVQRKDYIGAIIQYESVLETQPGDVEVLQMLVECCTAEGMAERGADFAQQLLERAREVADMRRIVAAANAILAYDPTRAPVRRDLAEALLCLNRIPDAIAEWARAAEEFVTAGDLGAAAECCRRITQVTPDNLGAWKRLADILAFADEPEEARKAYLHLATAYADSGDPAAAIAVLRRLSDINPADPLPHERTLELHLRTGKHAEAIEEILWLVRFRMREGNLEAAERLVERGVEIDPESLTLQQCRLEIVRGLGRTDELRLRMQDLADRFKEAGELRKAADMLEQILAIDANQPSVRRELGTLWLALGETSRAYDEFGRLLQGILDRADTEEARDTAEAILREQGDDLSLRAEFARVFTDYGMQEVGGRYYAICAAKAAETGDVASQVSYLKLATQARPRWTEGLRLLAEASAAKGDTDSAFESFQRLASLLVDAREFGEATSAIRRQISLRPKDPAPRLQLVELYGRIGDRENRAAALQDLADLYVSRGLTDEAVEVYRQLIELRPDDPDVLQRFVELFAQVGNELEIVDEYLRLAEVLTRKGAFVEATQTYEQILAIDRRNPVIREKFINFLQNHGQKGRALAEMRRLADTYVARGNRASAVNVLVNALAMSPRDAELCLRLAAAYEAVGNQEAALQSYARAASLLADTAPIRAIDLYTKLLEKDPQNTEIRRRLAEAYARAGEQSKAASQARRLAEIHSARGEIEQAEAAYRLASTNKPESLTALRDAVQLHTHDPMLQYVDLVRYGDALMESGYTDEALDQYRKARAINDERPQLIQKCIDALSQIAPEREAIPDLLTLAERHLTAGEAATARTLYERVLQLDPACENAKGGRDTAFRMELLAGAGTGPNPLDQQPLRSPHAPKKARVGMNDLLGAFGEEDRGD